MRCYLKVTYLSVEPGSQLPASLPSAWSYGVTSKHGSEYLKPAFTILGGIATHEEGGDVCSNLGESLSASWQEDGGDV